MRRNLASGDGRTDLTYKVMFWDKPKALEMGYKHHGLLAERVEHQGVLETGLPPSRRAATRDVAAAG